MQMLGLIVKHNPTKAQSNLNDLNETQGNYMLSALLQLLQQQFLENILLS